MRRRRHVVSVVQPAWDERDTYAAARLGWPAFWDGLRARLGIRPRDAAELGGAVATPAKPRP